MTALRIPGLIDVLTVSDAATILAMADDPELDRAGTGGPLVNRLLRRRLAGALRSPDGPLPSALPRDSAERRAMRVDLAATLADPALWPRLEDAIAQAARFVAGGDGAAGPLAQTLFGRVFVADFAATAETWDAARVIDRALAPPGLRSAADALTGRVAAAQRVLARAMQADRNGVHAIGVAAHNFAATLGRLRALDKGLPAREALAKALVAPVRAARQGLSATETPAGRVRPGALVLLNIGRAAERTLDPRLAFLRDAWSGCPAHAFAPDLAARIWRAAGGAA